MVRLVIFIIGNYLSIYLKTLFPSPSYSPVFCNSKCHKTVSTDVVECMHVFLRVFPHPDIGCYQMAALLQSFLKQRQTTSDKDQMMVLIARFGPDSLSHVLVAGSDIKAVKSLRIIHILLFFWTKESMKQQLACLLSDINIHPACVPPVLRRCAGGHVDSATWGCKTLVFTVAAGFLLTCQDGRVVKGAVF